MSAAASTKERKLWLPGSKSFIKTDSKTGVELEEETAILLQRWCRTHFVKQHLPGPDEQSHDAFEQELVKIALQLKGWRLATNFLSLDDACIQHGYAGENAGVRDFDLGTWFVLGDCCQQGADQLWEVDEIKGWFTTVLQDTDAFVESGGPLHQRIRDIVCDWRSVRLHIPPSIRDAIAEGFFSHMQVLRRCMYEQNQQLWQESVDIPTSQ